MPKIPLIDLRAQYQSIKPEIDAAIQRVLDSGQFILGPEVDALERELAAYCGVQHAVAVASGTDALELSLRAFGIGPGDEVITTAFSFFATAEAIALTGAQPVFVDIESTTYNLDPEQLASKITPRTKAIIPVHLYGHPAPMDRILSLARSHGLKVLEDGAQAIGARFQGRRVGSFGDAAALSFYPSKNLGAYGDAGAVLTNDGAVADRLRLLRVHGSRDRYQHLVLGRNSRLDDLQAAVLRVKLRHLDAWNTARRQHAAMYAKLFQQRALTELVLPVERPGCEHVYHLYPVRVARREQVKASLLSRGVAVQVYYPSILPSQPALALSTPGHFPRAEEAAQQILSLPMYPELTPSAIEYVVEQVAHAPLS